MEVAQLFSLRKHSVHRGWLVDETTCRKHGFMQPRLAMEGRRQTTTPQCLVPPTSTISEGTDLTEALLNRPI